MFRKWKEVQLCHEIMLWNVSLTVILVSLFQNLHLRFTSI
jgi:hypothetical protein